MLELLLMGLSARLLSAHMTYGMHGAWPYLYVHAVQMLGFTCIHMLLTEPPAARV